MIYTIRDLIGDAECLTSHDGRHWVRAIPVRYYGDYLRAAWAVLLGKAVAVRYPSAGELERALAESGGIKVEPAKVGSPTHG